LPENVSFNAALTGREILAFYARLKGEPVARNLQLLDRVGLEAAASRRVGTYSKGMRQRLGLAQALIGEPEVLLLDEPTSALDVSVQAEVLNLLMDLQQRRRLTYVMVGHNLAVVAHLCPRIGVMQGGEMVEQVTAHDLRAGRTVHPHTTELRALSTELEEA
jgi:peptide/nickel transport system ATP-binding protein